MDSSGQLNEINSRSLAQRSQFVFKLHSLLENPLDPNSLRWTDDIVFEISCSDEKAIHALSPNWDFNSLGSFIRQLSYYGFKRLSDRRRSGQVKQSREEFIIFSHPSGFFRRGDTSKLDEIGRKARSRVAKSVTLNSPGGNNRYNQDNNNSPRGKESSYDTPDDQDDPRHYKLGDPRRKAGHDDYGNGNGNGNDNRRGLYGGRDMYHGGGEGSNRAQPRRRFEDDRGPSNNYSGGPSRSNHSNHQGSNHHQSSNYQSSNRGNPVPYVVSPSTSPQPRSRLLPPLSDPYSAEQRSRPSSSASSYSSTDSRGPRLPPLNHMHGNMSGRSSNWIPAPIKSDSRGNLAVPDHTSPPSHFNRQQQQLQQQQQINRGRMPVSSERESIPTAILPIILPDASQTSSPNGLAIPVSVNSSLYRLLSHSPPRIPSTSLSQSTPGTSTPIVSALNTLDPESDQKVPYHSTSSPHPIPAQVVKVIAPTGWAKPFPPANPPVFPVTTITASSTSPISRTKALIEEEASGVELGRRRSLSVKKEV